MSRTNTPAVVNTNTDRPFGTDEQIAMVQKQIAHFIKATNNPPVLRELETVMKSGRDNVGWKHFGREFLAAIKEAAFDK